MEYTVEDLIPGVANEPFGEYGNNEVNQLTYKIIGAAMEVHRIMGRGFLEVVYKDCLAVEFQNRDIKFEREKKFEIIYKGIKIPRYYNADYVIDGKVPIEVKAQINLAEDNIKQTINYLAVSKLKIALLINFGEDTLKYKRIILTK